jgi:hypothetical protein
MGKSNKREEEYAIRRLEIQIKEIMKDYESVERALHHKFNQTKATN